MRDANNYLLLFLGLFWLLIVIGARVESRWHNRPGLGFSSLLSLVLLTSGVGFFVGVLINWLAAPWGTLAVAAFFVGYAVFATVWFGFLQRRDYRGRDEG